MSYLFSFPILSMIPLDTPVKRLSCLTLITECAAAVKTRNRPLSYSKNGDGFSNELKEYRKIPGMRMDYYDLQKTIFELKPMNKAGIKNGCRQLSRYNRVFGGKLLLQLELY